MVEQIPCKVFIECKGEKDGQFIVCEDINNYMKYYITGTRRGLGEALKEKYGSVNTLEECDIFINCKHDGFSQIDLLYKAAELGKRIINIGGSLEARKRHISRGKVLPRERIAHLLDDKDNALEIGELAGYDLNNNETPSGSIVCVIGIVIVIAVIKGA